MAGEGKDSSVAIVEQVVLESGDVLKNVKTCYRTWGQLNARRDNAIVVFHALNCTQHVEEWWGPLLGPGRALDTDRYFVFCANSLGGCFGSTGPDSIDSATGKKFGSKFPSVTIRDMVRLQAQVLRQLGVAEVACTIGGGLGGMLALEWGLEVQEPRARAIASICSSGVQKPWQIGWGECQRQAVFADPAWHGGDYALESPPLSGLAVARMMAMVTYRTHPAYMAKFGRTTSAQQRGVFDVQNYLHHQGDKFVGRGFSAASYVSLTKAMDSHDVGRGRDEGLAVLHKLATPTLLVSVSSDVLYPESEQLELNALLPMAQHHTVDSVQGHDAFLVEHGKFATLVHGFLLETAAAERAAPASKL